MNTNDPRWKAAATTGQPDLVDYLYAIRTHIEEATRAAERQDNGRAMLSLAKVIAPFAMLIKTLHGNPNVLRPLQGEMKQMVQIQNDPFSIGHYHG